MNVPEWARAALWGGIIGAVVFATISFSAGWVVTRSFAEKEGATAVLAALTPICVAQFKSQSQETQTMQLAALQKTYSYNRADYVGRQGWATLPGSGKPNNKVANACAMELMKLVQK